jgi:hypothetical protein
MLFCLHFFFSLGEYRKCFAQKYPHCYPTGPNNEWRWAPRDLAGWKKEIEISSAENSVAILSNFLFWRHPPFYQKGVDNDLLLTKIHIYIIKKERSNWCAAFFFFFFLLSKKKTYQSSRFDGLVPGKGCRSSDLNFEMGLFRQCIADMKK